MTSSSASIDKVVEAARSLGLDIAVRHFPEGTKTADEAARAVNVGIGQIVKSLVFLADGKPVLCLVSGSNRLSTPRLAALTGATEVKRADAEEARDATGYAVGGVPPFGHRQTLPVYCDRDLLQYGAVWAAAGTPMAVFSITPRSLVDACAAQVADIKEDG
jgi:Cys-tRNA(Pro) deacylase